MLGGCLLHEPAFIAEVRQKVEIAHGLEISSAGFHRAPGVFCHLIHPSMRWLWCLAARVRGKVCQASRRPSCSLRPCAHSARAPRRYRPPLTTESKGRYRSHRLRVASPLAANLMGGLLRFNGSIFLERYKKKLLAGPEDCKACRLICFPFPSLGRPATQACGSSSRHQRYGRERACRCSLLLQSS